MQVTAEQTNPCTIILDITVDEAQVSRAFESSYREFSRHTNIPGFRPGKAPRALVERYADKVRVKQYALEMVVRDAYTQAVKEQDITPYRDGEIAPVDLVDKKPFNFKATVPLEPQVKIGQYTGLTAIKPIYPVSDEIVESRIDALRDERAKLEKVTDRGVQLGDVVIADAKTALEGEEDNEEPKRQLIQIGNNIPGFDDALVGSMPGETRTFGLVYPADFAEEARQGKKATFTVAVNRISAKKMPEVNEEFVMLVTGEDMQVDEFKTRLKSQLEDEASKASVELAEQNLIVEILKNSEIYFPDILIRDEVNDKLRHLDADLSRNQVSYSDYLARMNATAEQHQMALANQAATQIRALLALREIAIQEGLQADDDTIDAQFDAMADAEALTQDQADEYRVDPRRRLQIANAIIQDRLHHFLFENNTLIEEEEKDEPKTEALEASEVPTQSLAAIEAEAETTKTAE